MGNRRKGKALAEKTEGSNNDYRIKQE